MPRVRAQLFAGLHSEVYDARRRGAGERFGLQGWIDEWDGARPYKFQEGAGNEPRRAAAASEAEGDENTHFLRACSRTALRLPRLGLRLGARIFLRGRDAKRERVLSLAVVGE